MTSTPASTLQRRVIRMVRVWIALTAMTVFEGAVLLALFAVMSVDLAYSGDLRCLAFLVPLTLVVGLALGFLGRATWQGLSGLRRPRGYPEKHWRTVAYYLRWSIGLNLLLLASPVFWFAAMGLGIMGEDALADIFIFVGSIGIMVFPLPSLWLNSNVGAMLVSPTVLPYFQSEVGEIDTFAEGRFLSRRMDELDDRARLLEVTPLSEFGWNDDFDGEPLTWHQPAEGRVTVLALLDSLRNEPLDGTEHDELLRDLERVAHALARADEKQIPFCLLLRQINFTWDQEWMIRKGTCF